MRHRHEREERPALADQDALLENRVAEDRELHVLRRKFFAVGEHEHVLQAPADEDLAVADFGEIARMQPALAVQRLRGRFREVPVALHDACAARKQLPVRPEFHFDVVERTAHRLGRIVFDPIHRDHR